jgi:hypothetical protein
MRVRFAFSIAASLSIVVASFVASSSVGANGTAFDPASASFATPRIGWVLGTASCSRPDGCLTLLETVNTGRSWFNVSLPPSLVTDADRSVDGSPGSIGLGVRFANVDDGWIFGAIAVKEHQGTVAYAGFAPTLWSTHDGGKVWTAARLPSATALGQIDDVEAANGVVDALVQTASYHAIVESSPVGSDAWRRTSVVTLYGPAGGAQPSGAIVLKGANGWLVYGNDRGTSSSARLASNGTWVTWTPPCASVGHSFAVPVATSPRDLVALCTMGGFAYPLSKSAPPGATLGSSWLYLSTDAGATFTAGPELKPVKQFPAYANFSGILAAPRPRVYLVASDVNQHDELLASFDGGAHWATVYSNQVTYLSFINANDGVGLVTSSNARTMIMTVDGGRHWTPITF